MAVCIILEKQGDGKQARGEPEMSTNIRTNQLTTQRSCAIIVIVTGHGLFVADADLLTPGVLVLELDWLHHTTGTCTVPWQ
jgi:hypothetical protein